MDELMEGDAFCTGLSLGVALYQQKIITAHKRKEPIKINESLYYVQEGRERLQDMIDKICK